MLLHGRRRRAYCYCVKVDPRLEAASELPSGDRIAHLLLALRSDEAGFATVANLAFSGARWRLRRRMRAEMRPALDAALSRVRQRVEPPGLNPGQRANARGAARAHHDGHARRQL